MPPVLPKQFWCPHSQSGTWRGHSWQSGPYSRPRYRYSAQCHSKSGGCSCPRQPSFCQPVYHVSGFHRSYSPSPHGLSPTVNLATDTFCQPHRVPADKEYDESSSSRCQPYSDKSWFARPLLRKASHQWSAYPHPADRCYLVAVHNPALHPVATEAHDCSLQASPMPESSHPEVWSYRHTTGGCTQKANHSSPSYTVQISLSPLEYLLELWYYLNHRQTASHGYKPPDKAFQQKVVPSSWSGCHRYSASHFLPRHPFFPSVKSGWHTSTEGLYWSDRYATARHWHRPYPQDLSLSDSP